MKLSSNTILITGGASGIGFELAKQLHALGNTIIITGRDQTKLDEAKKKLPSVHTIKSDAGYPAAIELLYTKLIAEFPELNIVFNNAGVMKKINFHDRSSDLNLLTHEIEVNLMGPIRMAKQFLPHLKTKQNAAIVNVSSGLAFSPLPISPVYCATKAGLHSFTQSLRVQLKNTDIKVFELAPPGTETPLYRTGFTEEDTAGVKVMPVETLAKLAIKGMQNDVLEIRPGMSNALKWMSRIAPDFILNKMSANVDLMLAETKSR